MASIVGYSIDFYVSHLPLLLLFSVPFIIALLIPLFAPFPTFNDAGGIFLRLGSVFLNLNLFTAAVIVFSTLFSLLFLSFSIVAINMLVKHSRTATRIRRDVLSGIEKYTADVFMVLLLFTAVMALAAIADYYFGVPAIATAVVGVAVTPFFFYAPAAIVIDERRLGAALDTSASHFMRQPKYPVFWVAVSIALLTVADYVSIALGGTVGSRYLMLVFNGLFLMPFLVVLQSQAYMRRFPLLKL